MIREDLVPGVPIYLAIPSASRPQNVAPMRKIVGAASWYVPPRQVPFYEARGATAVPSKGYVASARNDALRDAWGAGVPCLQLDDDLIGLIRLTSNGRREATFAEVVAAVVEAMDITGALLGGVPPTANHFFGSYQKPIRTSVFIIGSFCLVKPCDMLFDTSFRTKEDYDYTLQHLERYGVVARREDVMADFRHRVNAGGCQEYRSDGLEMQSRNHMMEKWPNHAPRHPKRSWDISLRWRGDRLLPVSLDRAALINEPH
jgi:hypothetical protein